MLVYAIKLSEIGYEHCTQRFVEMFVETFVYVRKDLHSSMFGGQACIWHRQ